MDEGEISQGGPGTCQALSGPAFPREETSSSSGKGRGLCARSSPWGQGPKRGLSRGLLLADAGFDSGKVYEEAEGKYNQMIQVKGGGKVRDESRRETLRAFRLEIYWRRAVSEGIFGALKTRLNGRLQNLSVSNTQKEALLLMVCYVLRVLLARFRWF